MLQIAITLSHTAELIIKSPRHYKTKHTTKNSLVISSYSITTIAASDTHPCPPLHVPTPYLAEKVIRHRVSVQTKFFGEQHRRWQMLTLHMSHVDIGKAHVYVTSLSVWCTKKQSYIRTSKRPNKKYIHKQLHANVNRKYIY